MSDASFLDSNILIYTDDHDAPEKQAIALALVEAGQANRDLFVSTQTLEEYFSAATKKLKVPAATARGKVELFAQLQVVLITVDDVLGAIDVHRLHQISFWGRAAGTERKACGLRDSGDRRLAGWEAIRRSRCPQSLSLTRLELTPRMARPLALSDAPLCRGAALHDDKRRD